MRCAPPRDIERNRKGENPVKMHLAKTALLFTLMSAAVWAQVNAGEQKPEASLPFTMTTVTTFRLPWRLAFLPDGRMLITEKVGPVWLVSQQGQKIAWSAIRPPVYWQGQNGMLGVYVSPRYATDQSIYLTYAEPGDYGGGLALARAKLNATATSARLRKLRGAVAPDAQGQGRPGRRRGRLLARRPVSVPHGWRPPALHPRPGSGPARRQDPAPDAGRQTRSRQSQLRQDRRGHHSPDRSAQ